ncbi:MAG: hypothetical protein HND50_19750 [Calditrichaeota bacterium]|nr:hypothetical protein [Calditrichota bacterium]
MKFQIALFFFFTVFFSTAFAQEDINFKHLTVADGLSQNTISAIHHDSRGFMWFGTQDGLNRYDGYEFRVFRHDRDDQKSISANWIWSIEEDSSGHIWASTFGGGLSRFDRYTEEFITFKNDPDDPKSISHDTAWDFAEYPKGTFWVATNNGLNQMFIEKDKHGNILKAEFEYLPHDTVNNNVFRIVLAEGDYLWLTSPMGLYKFEIKTKTYTFYDLTPETDIFHRYQGSSNQAKSDYLWITSGEGLFRFNKKTAEVKHYINDPANPEKSIIDNSVISVLEADNGVVWVGTTTSLTLIYPSGNYQQLKHDQLNPGSLSHDYISSLYQDRNGLIWLGTRSGLDYYRPAAEKFKHIHFRAHSPNSMSSSSVISIIEDSFGFLWIGTSDGLNRYNPKTGKYQHYFKNTENPMRGPSSSYIIILFEDSNKNIWIGTRGGGVCLWERKTGLFKHFTNAGLPGISIGTILSIIEDEDNDIWVGSNGAGLFFYDKTKDTFEQMPFNIIDPTTEMNDLSVFSLFIDSQGTFYVGTAAGGINIFHKKNRTFEHILNDPEDKNSISNNRIISFLETRDGTIWVGTAQGLNKLVIDEKKTGAAKYSFIQYLAKDGLPNEVIYGILEDEQGYLWISTNKGIAKIDISSENISVRSFTKDDGLQDNEFNQNALIDKAGQMYFGGINGYNVFDPGKIRLNEHKPPVRLTHLKIIDKEVKPSSVNGSVLTKSITETRAFTLPWTHNVFSLEFAALDFTTPEKNQFAYKMEGFDDEWIKSGSRRFVTYTNLDPGEYIFRVRGSNNDGIWNEEGTSIGITITPPPWQTWWAYILYFIFLSAAIFSYIQFKVREKDKELEMFARIEKAKSEERAMVRKKASADFHDEAGNLITKISLFVELAKRTEKKESQTKGYLEKIEENTKQLSGGMRDFIWSLDPGKDNLLDTMSRLEDFGNSMFEYSDIQFRAIGLKKKLSSINLALDDRRAIVLIFKEAMNNCLKYSKAKKAFLRIDHENEKLKIIFSDNGVGFNLDTIENGYGLTNMNSRAEKVDAVLEIDSIPKKETQIIFIKNLDAKS